MKKILDQKKTKNVGCSILLMIFLFTTGVTKAQLNKQAQEKITALETLITEAEGKGVDALKEKMTVRTAEIFLKFADWDAHHLSENEAAFAQVQIYKDTAAKAAAFLPDFERREVIKMLDNASAYLSKLINGTYKRKPIPNLDWSQITHDGDQLTFNGRPVFTADYTWKPTTDELTEFYGNEGGFYIDANKVTNKNGDVNIWALNQVKTKGDGSLGFMFMGNVNVPQWAENEYGPGFRMRQNTYTGYDIDNPGARKLQGMLLRKFVPAAAGKKCSELGYMLCNEPHFYTTKKRDTKNTKDWDWASGPVSDYTIVKFKKWLKNKHKNIARLNNLWQTSFSSFDEVTIDIPIYTGLMGTPKWYDWITFNRYRVTQWYSDLKDTIQKYDVDAKVHLKIMPNLWTNNKRGHGIDMEKLTELSEIIGNDSGADSAPLWGTHEWQKHYTFDWRELYMGFDFYKSVSPQKIAYNTESHYLSTVHSRDLFQDPMYARAAFWAAATQGLNANQIWLWGRLADGSIDPRTAEGYAGSNNQQPRIVNEVASVMMDLNSHAEEITAMQRQRKPIRIFHSETSAINKPKHMDDLFELYESLNFEGVPIGFATESIIKKQDNSLWDVILVHKTQFVTQSELNTLQNYLNNGGTVVIDHVSLEKNEYGKPLTSLTAGRGTLISVSSLESMQEKAWEVLDRNNSMPDVIVAETNGMDKKGCTWKCIKNSNGNNVLSIVNIGNTDANLTITLKGANVRTRCIDLLNGVFVTNKPTLKPNEVYFVEVKDGRRATAISDSETKQKKVARMYPNPSTGIFNIDFNQTQKEVQLSVYDMMGQTIINKEFLNVNTIQQDLEKYPTGSYLINVSFVGGFQCFKLLKR